MVRDMVKLLRILARHDPSLWEAIAPHVPKVWQVASSQDPIPPKMHVDRVLVLEVRETVRLVAEAALAAAASGQVGAAQQMLQDVDDDWCGTRWPRRWPKPGPRAEEYLLESAEAWQVVQAAGALALGGYAAAVDDEKLAVVFGDAADHLANAALKGAAR